MEQKVFPFPPPFVGPLQANDFSIDSTIGHIENADASLGLNPTPSERARVEKKDAGLLDLGGGVGMAKDDTIDSFEFPSDSILNPLGCTPTMDQADAKSSHLKGPLVRERLPYGGGVHIPEDSVNLLDFQPFENRQFRDISAVENHFHIGEGAAEKLG
jgi:hypothetical protein